jgi:hypothetical protein
MEDVQNRFARELADAIAAAVAESAEVERCRGRAKAAGYHLRVTLEATVGFSAVDGQSSETIDGDAATGDPASLPAFEVSANDRRFLRSLRIAADEVNVQGE